MAGTSGLNKAIIFDTKENFTPCCAVTDLANGIFCSDYGNISNMLAFGGIGTKIMTMDLFVNLSSVALL